MNATLSNIYKIAFIVLIPLFSCSEDSEPEYHPFPGYSVGTLNGNNFEYELSSYGRGSDYSYSTSFKPMSDSEGLTESLTIRFKTKLCSNCEWERIPSEELLEVIAGVDWILSPSEEQGVSIIYLDGTEKIYYSDINAELNTNNQFMLDTAYISEYDLDGDFREPYEKIIIVEGEFFSTLTNVYDENDKIILNAEFKGFLNSESAW